MSKSLWNDESGSVLATEYVLITTIIVVGLVSGMNHLRHLIVHELGDLGTAIQQATDPGSGANSSRSRFRVSPLTYRVQY